TGKESAELLRDYLAELLTLFDRDARIVTTADVAAFTESQLAVTLQTAILDKRRSALHREVKAITYHKLDVRVIPGGFEATLIVDI
ncbi:MAG: archease, partial [Phycisphaerales bacterium]